MTSQETLNFAKKNQPIALSKAWTVGPVRYKSLRFLYCGRIAHTRIIASLRLARSSVLSGCSVFVGPGPCGSSPLEYSCTITCCSTLCSTLCETGPGCRTPSDGTAPWTSTSCAGNCQWLEKYSYFDENGHAATQGSNACCMHHHSGVIPCGLSISMEHSAAGSACGTFAQ